MATVAAPGTTNTESAGLINIVDRNALVWWALLLTSVLLAVFVTPWGALFWLVALALDDVLMIFGKAVLFDSQLRMRRNYQWMHNMYDNTTGSGRDLGFNLVVDGELSQQAKWEHMAHELKLKPGMVICDVGCGYGDWLKYCRDELGCEAVGVNITPEQAEYARKEYGLEVHVTNWKDILTNRDLQRQLYGRFDAVTFMDTVEHYVSMEDRRNLAKQERIYSDMCRMARELIRPNSPSRRVFISCLHQSRRPRTVGFYWHAYFMDRFYSGHYPFEDEGPMKVCGQWFDVVKVDDRTEDYRLTGVRDRRHFQAVRIHWTPKKAAYIATLFFLDPFVLHRLLYYTQDSWMKFYGENPYSEEYDAEYRRRVSFVVLFWITLAARSAKSEASTAA